MSIQPKGAKFSEILFKIQLFSFIQESAFEYIVCQMVAILSWPQCAINDLLFTHCCMFHMMVFLFPLFCVCVPKYYHICAQSYWYFISSYMYITLHVLPCLNFSCLFICLCLVTNLFQIQVQLAFEMMSHWPPCRLVMRLELSIDVLCGLFFHLSVLICYVT